MNENISFDSKLWNLIFDKVQRNMNSELNIEFQPHHVVEVMDLINELNFQLNYELDMELDYI